MESEDITGDVAVHLELNHKNDSYQCKFTFSGRVEIPCDRCLAPMEYPISTEYDITIRYADDYQETDDVIVIPDSMRDFDISQILRDTILLELPLRRVHADGKCDSEMEQILRRHEAKETDAEKEDQSKPE